MAGVADAARWGLDDQRVPETGGWSQALWQVTRESHLLQPLSGLKLQLECGPRNALCANVSSGLNQGQGRKVTAQG